jgi:hypothetical protein
MAKIVITAADSKGGDAALMFVSFDYADGVFEPNPEPYYADKNKMSARRLTRKRYAVCDIRNADELALFSRAMSFLQKDRPDVQFRTQPAPQWLLQEVGESAKG